MTKAPSSPQFDDAPFKDIISYYDRTRFDYNVAWLNQDNLAVHFGFYDRDHMKHQEALINTNQVLARLSGIQAGDRVLDAGCGRGGSALWLAKNKDANVTGVAPVPGQIKEATQHAKTRKLDDKADFLVADYCRVPLPDEQFDVVWACESLCHADDKSAFYKEAFRLLKPGGRLVVAEYIRYKRPLSASGESLLLSWLNGWAIPDIDTPDEHRAHAFGAGFKTFELKDYTRFTWISLKNLYKMARKWLWADYLLYGLRIRSKDQHNNILGSIRQYRALKKDLWFYGVILATKEERHV